MLEPFPLTSTLNKPSWTSSRPVYTGHTGTGIGHSLQQWDGNECAVADRLMEFVHRGRRDDGDDAGGAVLPLLVAEF